MKKVNKNITKPLKKLSIIVCTFLCIFSYISPTFAFSKEDDYSLYYSEENVKDSRWPVENETVQKAWSEGINGKGVKIAIIDSSVVKHPGLEGADVTYKVGIFDDKEGKEKTCKVKGKALKAQIDPGEDLFYYTHGTQMLLWLVGNGQDYNGHIGILGIVPKAKVLMISDGYDTIGTTLIEPCDQKQLGTIIDNYGKNMETAIDWGARIINHSQEGAVYEDEINSYIKALQRGIIMVSGRANNTEPGLYDLVGDPDRNNYFPGTVTVNSVDRNGTLASTSNTNDGNIAVVSYGYGVTGPATQTNEGEMTGVNGGTSTAAVILTGYLTLAMQKWPEATGNQIIQSLIRNTKGSDGTPKLDSERKKGFGEVDLEKLLTVDPTQYPDINPILEYEIKASAQYEESKDWYTQDCEKDDELLGTTINGAMTFLPCELGLVKKEYERQKNAWDKVLECREDGGKNCMKYSATNIALHGDPDKNKSEKENKSNIILIIAGAIGVLVIAIIVFVFVRKKKNNKNKPSNINYSPNLNQNNTSNIPPIQNAFSNSNNSGVNMQNLNNPQNINSNIQNQTSNNPNVNSLVCPKCGTKLNPGTTICFMCGTKIN